MITLTPNYRNLAVLHNWLLANRQTLSSRYEIGQWATRDFDREHGKASAFGWAALEGDGVLRMSPTLDNNGMMYFDEPVKSWPKYLARVYGLNMGNPEFAWIESCRWRQRDNSFYGVIARIRFVIDNALDLPGLGELLDVLSGDKPLPYDILENRPYDLKTAL